MLNVLGVKVGEAREFRLIQIHHEEFVRRRKFCALRSELLVEIAYVLSMTLECKRKRSEDFKRVMYCRIKLISYV